MNKNNFNHSFLENGWVEVFHQDVLVCRLKRLEGQDGDIEQLEGFLLLPFKISDDDRGSHLYGVVWVMNGAEIGPSSLGQLTKYIHRQVMSSDIRCAWPSCRMIRSVRRKRVVTGETNFYSNESMIKISPSENLRKYYGEEAMGLLDWYLENKTNYEPVGLMEMKK